MKIKVTIVFFQVGNYQCKGPKIKKCDITLIEINVICEVPIYFKNKIIINSSQSSVKNI